MNNEHSIGKDYQKPPKPLSQNAIGRALGLAPSTTAMHKRNGMPVDSLESARAWHEAHHLAQHKPAQRTTAQAAPQVTAAPRLPAPACASPAKPIDQPSEESFDAARTREKIAAANLVEMEEAALRGTYLIKADFERYLFNAGRMLRDTLTNCARRISAEVAGLATAGECEVVIDREHRAALASFAQSLRQNIKIEIENNPLNAPRTTP